MKFIRQQKILVLMLFSFYMVMFRDQDAGQIRSIWLITVPLKLWKGSNIWEQIEQIKILFLSELF